MITPIQVIHNSIERVNSNWCTSLSGFEFFSGEATVLLTISASSGLHNNTLSIFSDVANKVSHAYISLAAHLVA